MTSSDAILTRKRWKIRIGGLALLVAAFCFSYLLPLSPKAFLYGVDRVLRVT